MSGNLAKWQLASLKVDTGNTKDTERKIIITSQLVLCLRGHQPYAVLVVGTGLKPHPMLDMARERSLGVRFRFK
eukprot:12336482-Heterocapsa_arctica.AAC.1